MSNGCVLTCVFQSFNAPRCSKMRVWKEVTLVFILFGASFFLLLMKTTSPVGSSYPKAFGISFEPSLKPLATALEPPPSSSSSSARKPAPRREVRATEDMGSFLSECKRNLFSGFPWATVPAWIRLRWCRHDGKI